MYRLYSKSDSAYVVRFKNNGIIITENIYPEEEPLEFASIPGLVDFLRTVSPPPGIQRSAIAIHRRVDNFEEVR